ncbi:MAG: hypothetical protein ABW039_04490 [Sphingobium sp.]
MNEQLPSHSVFICNSCGSDAIAREAWAQWDAISQAWVLDALFDHAHCHGCGSHSKPQQVLLSQAPIAPNGGVTLP